MCTTSCSARTGCSSLLGNAPRDWMSAPTMQQVVNLWVCPSGICPQLQPAHCKPDPTLSICDFVAGAARTGWPARRWAATLEMPTARRGRRAMRRTAARSRLPLQRQLAQLQHLQGGGRGPRRPARWQRRTSGRHPGGVPCTALCAMHTTSWSARQAGASGSLAAWAAAVAGGRKAAWLLGLQLWQGAGA